MKDKSVTLAEVTEVLYGIENAVGRGEQFMKNAWRRMKLFSQTTKYHSGRLEEKRMR